MANEEAMNGFLIDELDAYMNGAFLRVAPQIYKNYVHTYQKEPDEPFARRLNFGVVAHNENRNKFPVDFPFFEHILVHPIKLGEMDNILKMARHAGKHFPGKLQQLELTDLQTLFKDSHERPLVVYAVLRLLEDAFPE